MRTRVVGPISVSVSGIATDVGTALAAFFADAIIKTEIHDITAAPINGSGSAFIAFGSGAALLADIKRIQISYTSGQPLVFALGADATAAAAASPAFLLNQGDGPVVLSVAIPSGSKIWVRSGSVTGVTGGYLTANLMG